MMELEPAHPGLAGEEPTVAENDRARREGRNGRRIFAAALVPLTIYAIHILRLPLDALLGVVPDDAFYYLSIARHLAASGFSSLDGINPTNGYHPAWMLLTTLCAGIIDDREMLLRGVLLLGMLLHVGTGLLLARIVRRLFGELWGWTGGALWLVNPFPLLLDLQGVETPFYFLALALVIDRLVSLILRHPDEDVPIPPSTGWLATLGAFLGLAFLGRSEAIVMATGSLLLLAWMLRRGGIVAILRSLSIVSLTFLLVVSPWLLYSWRLLGTAAQDSGVMKMLWAAAERGGMSVVARASGLGTYINQFWLGGPVGMLFGIPHQARKFVPALLGLLLLWWVVRRRAVIGDAPLRRLSIWLFGITISTGAIYGLLLTDSQLWHCGQAGLVIYLLLFCWGITALRSAPPRRWLAGSTPALGLLGMALVLLVKFVLTMPNLYPWQRDVHRSQPGFEAEVPRGMRIGSFNAGIPNYFGGREVINLDGLVNHTVIPYWREGRFEAYLRDAGIAYIADENESLSRARSFSSAPFTLVPVDSVELTGWSSRYRRLWKVEGGEMEDGR